MRARTFVVFFLVRSSESFVHLRMYISGVNFCQLFRFLSSPCEAQDVNSMPLLIVMQSLNLSPSYKQVGKVYRSLFPPPRSILKPLTSNRENKSIENGSAQVARETSIFLVAVRLVVSFSRRV